MCVRKNITFYTRKRVEDTSSFFTRFSRGSRLPLEKEHKKTCLPRAFVRKNIFSFSCISLTHNAIKLKLKITLRPRVMVIPERKLSLIAKTTFVSNNNMPPPPR